MCMYTNCFILVSLFFHIFKVKPAHQWVCIINLEKSLLIMPFKFKEQIHWVTGVKSPCILQQNLHLKNKQNNHKYIVTHCSVTMSLLYSYEGWTTHQNRTVKIFLFWISIRLNQVQLVSCFLRIKEASGQLK